MKWVALAVIGFVLGMVAGHLRQRVPHFEWPTMPAMQSLRAVLPKAVLSSSDGAPTLRTAIEPVYSVLFGRLDDGKAVAVALEETVEIEKLMTRLESDGASEAARRVVAMLKAACSETDRFSKSSAQPVSDALGGERGSSDFFGSVFEKRWRANMAVLATKAAPDWQRFLETDAATPCPEKSQIAIATLLGQRRLRELERTAILVDGSVSQVLDGGALVSMGSNADMIFVSAITQVVDDSPVRILVHPAGEYQYLTPAGVKKTVRKYRFYRNAGKNERQPPEPQ